MGPWTGNHDFVILLGPIDRVSHYFMLQLHYIISPAVSVIEEYYNTIESILEGNVLFSLTYPIENGLDP